MDIYSEKSALSPAYGAGQAIAYRHPTVREQVRQRIDALESNLKDLKEILEALDANPKTEALLDAMRKAHL